MRSRMLCSVLIAGYAVQLVGCGDVDVDADADVGADGLPTDPVANFKAFLPGEFERMSREAPTVVLASDYSINVEKTDSLVSPLVGTCTLGVASTYTNSKHGLIGELVSEYTIKYGWQDGKWACTTGVATIKDIEIVKGGGKGMDRAFNELKGKSFNFKGSDGLIKTLKSGEE